MLTRKDIPNLLTSGLRREFMKAQKSVTTSIYKEVCLEVTSTKASEPYAWLGSVPKMKKWVSERVQESLKEYSYNLENEDYEATLAIDRNARDDDQYGAVKVQVAMLAQEAERFYDEKMTEVIEAGTSALCYDGQYMFDTDHSSGDSGSQSNAPSAASGYDFTYANGAAVAKLVIGAMRQFKDDKGKHYGANPTHVMVATSCEFTALELFDPSHINQAATGQSVQSMKGRFKVIVNPYLTNDGTVEHSAVYWLDLSKPIKPFIFQNRQSAVFTALDKEDSENNFLRRKLLYGVHTRFAFGYGEWKLAYRTQGA